MNQPTSTKASDKGRTSNNFMLKPIISAEEPRKSGKRSSFLGIPPSGGKSNRVRMMKSPSERVLMKPLRGSIETGLK